MINSYIILYKFKLFINYVNIFYNIMEIIKIVLLNVKQIQI